MATLSRLTIAIDCDDVIVATAPAIIDFYNARYGTQIDMKDFYSTDHTAVWGAPDEQTAIRRVDEFLRSSEFQRLPPFREAIAAIQQLKARHDLHIVTGRSDYLADATHAMLEQYFPATFRSVEFTNFFTDKPRPKSQVCQDLGADLLIDDHLHHAEVVAACGIPVLLFGDYPWNQTDNLPATITRVSGWSDVTDRLLA